MKCDEHRIYEEWWQAFYSHFPDKAGIHLHDDYTKHDWNFDNNEYSLVQNINWEMDFLPDEDSGMDTCSETSSSNGSSIDRPRFLIGKCLIKV